MSLSTVLFILHALLVLWFLISFDILVRYEYNNFHQQWRSDGEPTGEFWWPGGVHPSPNNSIATLALMIGWLIGTPEWAKSDSDAKKLFWLYRIAALVNVLAFAFRVFSELNL